jgi:hypothetical protein
LGFPFIGSTLVIKMYFTLAKRATQNIKTLTSKHPLTENTTTLRRVPWVQAELITFVSIAMA